MVGGEVGSVLCIRLFLLSLLVGGVSCGVFG
jgi:hypothetical protein